MAIAIASLPASFAALHLPCTVDNSSCNGNGLLTASQMQELLRQGFSLDAYAWSFFGISGFTTLVSLVLGGIIFWRKSDDWMALLVALLAISEVDMQQLREHLLAVVEETMQPAHVSLWLRPTAGRGAGGQAKRLEPDEWGGK